MNTKTPVENFYRRNEGALQIIAIFALPFFLALMGIIFTNVIEQSKMRQEYVRISTGILAQKVEGDDSAAIREWATEILSLYSPIKIDETQREDLISGKARTASSGWGSNWGSSDP